MEGGPLVTPQVAGGTGQLGFRTVAPVFVTTDSCYGKWFSRHRPSGLLTDPINIGVSALPGLLLVGEEK